MDSWHRASGREQPWPPQRYRRTRKWGMRLLVVGAFLGFVIGVAYFVNWGALVPGQSTQLQRRQHTVPVEVTINPG